MVQLESASLHGYTRVCCTEGIVEMVLWPTWSPYLVLLDALLWRYNLWSLFTNTEAVYMLAHT